MKSEYLEIHNNLLPFNAKLVAVSKRQPLDKIEDAYALGQRLFGENRVQEFLEKKDKLPEDIKWHLIGHLQTNKVKQIVGQCHLIHSLDRLKLAKVLNQESKITGVKTLVLIQIKIADEDSKFGYQFEALLQELAQGQYVGLENLVLCGVMGMATFTDDKTQIRAEFKKLKIYFDELKRRHFDANDQFREISMGMSGDYQIALEEGATIVRVGSKLFGTRVD